MCTRMLYGGTRTVKMKWMSRPGKGDFLVGKLEAQNRLPNGNGIPSFASSKGLLDEDSFRMNPTNRCTYPD